MYEIATQVRFDNWSLTGALESNAAPSTCASPSGRLVGEERAARPNVRARGDGIIQLGCLVDEGPFRRGLHFGYGHAQHAIVRVGQVVKGGQQIGRAGMANAWHIHFMVNRGGHRRGIGDHDPMPYVRYASGH